MTRQQYADTFAAALRPLMPGGKFMQPEVDLLNQLAELAERRSTSARRVNEAGIKLMHEFEGLSLKAYPDPGSKDGTPWTIGRGATGPGIGPGVVWTEAQADERFAADLARFAQGVSEAIGDAPTTSNQFSAMVSLAYNIGLKAFAGSTLLRKHKAGDYAGARAAFASWRMNDGKIMPGLVRRRAAEAALYGRSE